MYRVEWVGNTEWVVVFVPEAPPKHVIARTTTLADGEKIARALNEAQGL